MFGWLFLLHFLLEIPILLSSFKSLGWRWNKRWTKIMHEKMKELLLPIFHCKEKISWNKKKKLLLPILSIKRKQYFTKNHHTWKSLQFYHSSSWNFIKIHWDSIVLISLWLPKNAWKHIPWKCVHYKNFIGKKRQSRDVTPTYLHHMKSFELPLPLTPLCSPLASIAHTKVFPWNQNMHNLRRKKSLEVVRTLFLVVNKSNLSNLKPN